MTIILVSIIWPILIGAAWTPTSLEIVDKMLEMAKVNHEDIVYDLGSGDGRILIEASKKYGSIGVGIEADPIRVIWSNIAITAAHLNNKIKIIWGNIFNQNLSKATVITLFLWQRTNRRLKTKLQKELKPGTRLVSYIWTFDDWTPIKVDIENQIYLYIIGESDEKESK